jgi:hypothetical protein
LSTLDEIADMYAKHAEVDYVGLWQTAKSVRERLGVQNPQQVRELGLEIAKRLYDRGLRAGDYDYGGHMDFWPDEGRQAMLNRIKQEWEELDADPTHLDPICSFLRSGN